MEKHSLPRPGFTALRAWLGFFSEPARIGRGRRPFWSHNPPGIDWDGPILVIILGATASPREPGAIHPRLAAQSLY